MFYLSVVFFFTLYSILLDLLFGRIDYGRVAHYKFIPMTYVLFFGIGYLFPVLPIAILYNYVLSTLEIRKPYIRIIIGLLVGLFIGYIVKEGYSFYIGEYRPLKNVILFGLIGVSVEILRIIKSRYVKRATIKKAVGATVLE